MLCFTSTSERQIFPPQRKVRKLLLHSHPDPSTSSRYQSRPSAVTCTAGTCTTLTQNWNKWTCDLVIIFTQLCIGQSFTNQQPQKCTRKYQPNFKWEFCCFVFVFKSQTFCPEERRVSCNKHHGISLCPPPDGSDTKVAGRGPDTHRRWGTGLGQSLQSTSEIRNSTMSL